MAKNTAPVVEGLELLPEGEEPPTATRQGSHRAPSAEWQARFQTLRDHPGQWAKLGEYSSNVVSSINKGGYAGIEEGEFEAKGRTTGKTEEGKPVVTVYARYVGVSEPEVDDEGDLDFE